MSSSGRRAALSEPVPERELENKTDLVIVGAGETAEIAYEYFTNDSPYRVIGFSAEKSYLKAKSFLGLPVVDFATLESSFPPDECRAFVAVSYTRLNRVRKRLYLACKDKGFQLASYVSSKAFVWHNVTIGENCFVFENNVLQHRVEVGNNVVLWSGNHVGHRSRLKDHCYLTSHVVVSGYCEVGEHSFLGVNSTLADNVTIAPDCLIAAGAVVLGKTEAAAIYQGNPAAKREGLTSLRFFRVRE